MNRRQLLMQGSTPMHRQTTKHNGLWKIRVAFHNFLVSDILPRFVLGNGSPGPQR